jgi:hypothetical protein
VEYFANMSKHMFLLWSFNRHTAGLWIHQKKEKRLLQVGFNELQHKHCIYLLHQHKI